ncbi:MAG: hypothetical protein P4L84_27200 [Isosphaeraceae bacterium]|nr:hypothetical protein [Isosphaeraceae bacterium]
MRSLCTLVSGAVLASAMACFVTGCGDGATSELAKVPESASNKPIDPKTDMPGYKEMQATLKNKKK